jgi:hypothetical protein
MKKLSAKERLGQKVLIRAINEFLRRGLFTLESGGNHLANPVIEFEMEGISAIASVADIGHDELTIHITLWPNERGKEFIQTAALHSNHRLDRGGFYAKAWLERKNGAWLQTSNGLPHVSCARDKRGEVERMTWEKPLGYSADGQFNP